MKVLIKSRTLVDFPFPPESGPHKWKDMPSRTDASHVMRVDVADRNTNPPFKCHMDKFQKMYEPRDFESRILNSGLNGTLFLCIMKKFIVAVHIDTLFVLLCSIAIINHSCHAFQVTKISSSTSPELKPIPSPKTSHVHEFWRKIRSKSEVEAHVISSLESVERMASHCPSYSPAQSRVQVVSAEPPLVVIHDFISSEMCTELIQLAQSAGLSRSTTGNEQAISTSRTSSTVWLADCDAPKPSRWIAEAVSQITGLPTECMENLQIARYQPGQQFHLHTDHRDSFNDLECGGRLATFLIYLAEPDAGGATYFPGLYDDDDDDDETNVVRKRLDVTVTPTRGSAVFFWNTIQKPGCESYDCEMFLDVDMRLRHAGLPVEAGEKWIANRWVHPIDTGLGVRGISR
jgi:prolyl 4-hydroxylase